MAEIEITKEFMEKAAQVKSAEELLALAKEDGIEMDEAQANEMLEKLAELSDEDVENIAGGIIFFDPDPEIFL